ncbi:AAA family ATPase [Mycetocola sp.]|uniref:AAA family ATPase n=1 Tax=Mycetocola sp. TaxID=1871042 RepID=UPI00398A4FC1
MLSELNPYSPGSGLTPPHLVGRQDEIDAFDLLVARNRGGRHSRAIVLHGLRGVGKTVLLNQFRDQADRAEWLIVDLEGQASESGQEAVRRKLARELALAARRLYRGKGMTEKVKQALSTIRSFGISFGGASLEVGIEPAIGRADSGRIEVDFEELIEDLVPALKERDSAFGLFIDEMQDLEPELLTALLSAQHRAGQRGWPFFVIGAGLPNLPSTLSAARSYAERLFSYREIGALDEKSATDALVVPAKRQGAEYDVDAAELIVGASGGYPYYLQTYGQAAWELALDRRITKEDATAAIQRGNEELDMGFFPARWDRATPGERNYLAAMAEDAGNPSQTSELASRLKTKPQSLSPVRQSLIEKGIIYVPDRGLVAFTVPNMNDFVSRQLQD